MMSHTSVFILELIVLTETIGTLSSRGGRRLKGELCVHTKILPKPINFY